MYGDKAPAYHVSKAALIAYTLVIARAMSGSGIIINAFSPGWTATTMGGKSRRPAAESTEGVVWAALVTKRESDAGQFYMVTGTLPIQRPK